MEKFFPKSEQTVQGLKQLRKTFIFVLLFTLVSQVSPLPSKFRAIRSYFIKIQGHGKISLPRISPKNKNQERDKNWKRI